LASARCIIGLSCEFAHTAVSEVAKGNPSTRRNTMDRIFVPAREPEDWKQLLEKPDLHWKTGHSAKSLAYCWQEANDFPRSVRKVLRNSKLELFQDVKLLLAFPEYKVPLPGGTTCSQNDVFILAKGKDQLISIAVEGKVDEPFDQIVDEWKADKGRGKPKRLDYLCDLLGLDKRTVDGIRYQLLHRTASALIEAKKFKAKNALMLVHSFSQANRGFNDYCEFLKLFAAKGEINSLVFAKQIEEVDLYFGWVKGEKKYLEK